MNYFVPNFGIDRDIAGALANIPVAEGLVGQKWTSMGTDFNKAKFRNRAKDADYDFQPKLEPDMTDSINNLKNAETALNHKYDMNIAAV